MIAGLLEVTVSKIPDALAAVDPLVDVILRAYEEPDPVTDALTSTFKFCFRLLIQVANASIVVADPSVPTFELATPFKVPLVLYVLPSIVNT